MNKVLFLCCMIVCCLMYTSCHRFFHINSEKASTRVDTSFVFHDGSSFSLKATNCKMHIMSSNNFEASFHIKKIVHASSFKKAQEHLNDILLEFTNTSDGMTLRVKHPEQSGVSYLTEIDAQFPSHTNLSLESLNGDISIRGFAGSMKTETTNGKIEIDDCVGACNVSSTNGMIEISNTFPDNTRSEIKTINGLIKITIPESTNATINASTVNGAVNVDNLPIKQTEKSRTEYKGVIGSGGGSIEVSAVNGAITIRGRK